MSANTVDMIKIFQPATGEAYTSVPRTRLEELDHVFERARQVWLKLPAVVKGELLYQLSKRLEEVMEEIAQIEAQNTGKSIRDTHAEAVRMPNTVRYWAGGADKIHGTTIPFSPNFHTYGSVDGLVDQIPSIFKPLKRLFSS